MPFTVCGSWAAFLYALQGVFGSVGLFLFVGVCSCMPFLFSELVKRFRGIVGGVFGLGVAVCVLLFVLLCSVMA